ncbi:trehalase-like domain-containing protein [Actinotalea sp.]|uniref:trehalase-like domain-containing protein n=1 Tax=Actinotalea sp. TaxID=1872145 RepID=UPI0035644F54
MVQRIGDHALIGDTHTAALVARDGSITWLCLPPFDSPAAFASLLGDEDNGHWTIAPREEAVVTRRYVPGTLVLETEMRTSTGTVRMTDFVPHRHGTPTVVRIVEGIDGEVTMQVSLCIRFDSAGRPLLGGTGPARTRPGAGKRAPRRHGAGMAGLERPPADPGPVGGRRRTIADHPQGADR